MGKSIDDRLREIFDASDPERSVIVRVDLDGGFKVYTSFGEDESKITHLQLKNEKEEEVFKMFRYPELYCSEVKDYVIQMLSASDEFRNQYTTNAFRVRRELREKFRDVLMYNAKKVLGESEGKEIYKSKTVIANTATIVSVLSAEAMNVDIPDAYAIIVLAILNIILRLLTKKPIKV